MTRLPGSRRGRSLLTLGTLLLGLAGCSTMPAFGPSAAAIDKSAADIVADTDDVLPFRIIDVSASTLPAATASGRSFPAAFRGPGLRTTDEVIAVGDRLEIRLWEVAEDGLFASAGRRETVLNAVVSNSGEITAPYANTITARGLTTAQLRAVLLERYRGQAIEPEIAVAITETQSRATTVLGAVGTPGRVVIASSGIRLLDLIAQAGGTSHADWEVSVTVQRASSSATVLLSDILENSASNIVIFPGDIVSIAHVPRRFVVYGAVKRPGNIEIPLEEAHLAYLLSEVGGLNDRIAQARAVFVFRPAAAGGLPEDLRATAYRFDFSRPDTLLLAGMFRLEPTDITYVASADAVDFQKFVSIILSPILGSASTATNLGD
ncbi:SLBB domain-containing protein [Tabrizicola sp.]|uniref:SLBB domain-containing protein n=1 Tax=Tabrizicola sp. TaxID=2005166 RepID=UPI00261DC2E1|nr:SLBB domain-containing protein [Tabrizicola sp.]MDM7932221.1 SLBB domain-containing protein [Tabrizicola sp.]